MRYGRTCAAFVVLFTLGSSGIVGAAPLRSIVLKGAFTSASVDQPFSGIERRTGVNAGIEAEWPINSAVSLVTSAEYAGRGWTITDIPLTDGTRADYTTRLDYLSFPFMLRVAAPRLPLRPFVQAGPRLDAFMGLKSDLLTDQDEDKFRNVIFGGSIGAGLQFAAAPRIIGNVSLRYNFDLQSYGESKGVHLDYKSSAIDLWLGFGALLDGLP